MSTDARRSRLASGGGVPDLAQAAVELGVGSWPSLRHWPGPVAGATGEQNACWERRYQSCRGATRQASDDPQKCI
jgi:hypothetical protein